LHGFELEAGDTITATGNASVRGAVVNQGTIAGPATGWLTMEDDVTGAGSYTGNVLFSDGFSPGNSPATVSFENVIFDDSSTLTLEIGGDGAGDEHDQIVVTGSAQLNGTLVVDFIDLGQGEFVPSAGDVFQLFSGATTGAFDSVVLPELPSNVMWDTSALASGTVEVAPVPPDADFDADGDVDGSDLLAWQRGLGTTGSGIQGSGDADANGVVDGSDLAAWSTQFGGANAITAATPAPEPSALMLALAVAPLAIRWRIVGKR
jgi:hypothetical protein